MKTEQLLKSLAIKKSRIEYGKLKKLLGTSPTDVDQKNFQEEFDREFKELILFIKNTNVKIKNKAGNLKNTTEDEELKVEISNFAEFVTANIMAAKKIILRHDKLANASLMKNYKKDLKEILKLIENFKLLIKEIGKQEQKAKILENFTSQFWIPADNIVDIKLGIAQYLDKISYVNNATRLYDSVVSSIYLDNTNFSLYSSYLENKSNSFFIRLRWFGEKIDIVHCELADLSGDFNSPTVISIRIPENLVLSFINGKDIWDYLDDGLNNKKEIYDAIQQRITQFKLKPVVRTFFKRTIFESSENPRIKIHLDSNIAMIKEGPEYSYESDNLPLKSWARPDVQYNWPFRNLPAADIVRFPFVILKVLKHNTGDGSSTSIEWLEDLLSTSTIEKIPDFSKFVHGCSILYPGSGIVPDWISRANKLKYQVYGSGFKSVFNDGLVHIKGESEISYDFSQVSEENIEKNITVRVEPKAFFANERTFLNWIEFAIYSGGTGAAMVGLGNLHAYAFGVVLIMCTVIFSLYVLYLYHYRAIHIRLRHTVQYDDTVGVILLISIFVVMMILAFILKFPIKKTGI